MSHPLCLFIVISSSLQTSSRQTVFLPVVGLVPAAQLKPGDLVGVNKDSYLILDTLPSEYDNRVKVSYYSQYTLSIMFQWELIHAIVE